MRLSPSLAASTIRARSTIRTSQLTACAIRSSSRPVLTADLDQPARTPHSHHHPSILAEYVDENFEIAGKTPPHGHNLQEPPLGGSERQGDRRGRGQLQGFGSSLVAVG
jgi:hypothetical protein